MSSRTVIRGGLVITASDEIHADVLIEDGRVAALAATGTPAAEAFTAENVIDASGKYVIPGGVDGHTHMEMPFGGTYAADTFETGTRAAAWGGTTTIVDFAIQSVGHSLREGLDAWHAKAEGNCAIDYGFHMIVSDVNQETLKEMDLLVEEGVTSFKQFMAYPGVFYSDDGQILRAMQRAAENGGLIMMHAENGIAIDVLVEQALARGETDPRFHGEVRKALLEAEATHRAIRLAQVAGAPLYVVHVSATEAVAELTRARDEGLPVFGETCPQYLFLSTDNLAEPDFEGAKYVCSTPLRPKEHQAALWRGLRTNDLQVVSTDHCPFCFSGQKELGRGDFSRIPNGMPGVENRMDLLHQAVVEGHIGRRRWIEIACATPARMFGLYPKKGTIAPGADADIVVYDPHAEQVISAETHHMNVDYSAYEGRRITGRVETVLSRGEPVVTEREYTGRKGHGAYTPRATCQYLT
ncbi:MULTISPECIES: dihydropyrimidinase [Streptomyces]|uniref:D-hydantoinase n=1 Tax=Streptomyces coelicolor (strain ATCC BAA-471 / A3(2) / M145) TaxID=100226 RepID=HYDA_STRCO|nr:MULTISPECIES: dihydropyrimidinase [Streptomyces]O69809.1 RecName: Full=D-hydantoinase [Streptomyces coelicolor A3(2)]MDX2923937.1 dihydropyrimidinase [Streptomyces sp. NRRL_B-16638]MDX3409242.1 dihydropyrimidinase [Streptomyces sp. ME02-6977A]MYU45918.1 D-hydantoinase [Streptomyces sp. SID7813]NSL78661.1 dihydropyrimidinase [Streptomyces coelicolor]QFI46217.1 D-hydantoinase [Streptomyces coelicolor A3(2)]